MYTCDTPCDTPYTRDTPHDTPHDTPCTLVITTQYTVHLRYTTYACDMPHNTLYIHLYNSCSSNINSDLQILSVY